MSCSLFTTLLETFASTTAGNAGRSLDESFVVLPGSASALRQANSGSGQLRASAHGIPLQALDDCFAQLARTFELAFGETKVQRCC